MAKPDPAKAKKLVRFIDAWRDGADLEVAAREAGLDLPTARVFIDSIKHSLENGSGASAPAKAARPKRPKRRRGGGGLELTAVSDGASRGNPGKGACAVIIYDADGEELLRRSRALGVVTNNVAEYHGVLLALELAEQLAAKKLVLKLDSELAVRQLNGRYKVKNDTLKPLFRQAQARLARFEQVEVVHVPRTETKEADKLANAELDGKSDSSL